MRMLTRTIAAIGFVGVMAAGVPTASMAQGVYIEGPGVEFGFGVPRYHRYYDHRYRWGPRAWAYERPYYRHHRYYYDRW